MVDSELEINEAHPLQNTGYQRTPFSPAIAYSVAKDYSPEEDGNNPFVVAKGHSFVYCVFTAQNLDRVSVEFGDLLGQKEPFLSVHYDEATYTSKDTDKKSF